MISRLFAALALAAAPSAFPAAVMEMPARTLDAAPAAPMAFRAPAIAPVEVASLGALEQKAAAAEVPSGPLRVATVRALSKSVRVGSWTRAAGGYVARLRASSEGALGLRVKLDVSGMAEAIEARVQGADGRIEAMRVDPAKGSDAWTPWTDGATQVIELFSRSAPREDAVLVADILHFTDSPFAKATASICTAPTMCTTDDPILDAAMNDRKKSVFKMTYVDGSSGFTCSGTLINTERFPAPYLLTANHCINNTQSGASVTTMWFYENVACDAASGINPAFEQVAGGAQIVFSNYNIDSTLLLMNASPPAGVVYSSWNSARLSPADPIVSISHPRGDTSRFALGSISQEYRLIGRAQDFYGVSYSRGIIEGGSSGSGLFTLFGGTLQLRGILSGTTVRQPGGLSCTNRMDEGLYGRLEILMPEIQPFIGAAATPADDAPNRWFDIPNAAGTPLDQLASPLVFTNRRLDYAGDVDVYRFTLSREAVVTIGTERAIGTIDTVGSLLDSRGVNLESNDDVAQGNLNFGITRQLNAGTYFVTVAHFDALGTGLYDLRLSATAGSGGPNYTDLWWNSAETGWGVNVNHQGDILFATLFTYDVDGSPMWLVMSNGDRQVDGSYYGTLYRTTGPAFNASPWGSINYQIVGNMRFTFAGSTSGQLVYSVNGVTLTKAITRLTFSTPTTCTWSATDRSTSGNYTDLWWNSDESGWGVNVVHHGNTLFATLYTYDATGHGLWLSMSNGERTANGVYSGTLARTSGPPFNATNWSATPINYTAVGTMTFSFTHGNQGTLAYTVDGVSVTKSIKRLTFSTPLPICSP